MKKRGKLIGLGLKAQVGKDTFFNCLSNLDTNNQWKRIAFADELKKDLRDFVKNNYSWDVFNLTFEQKELLRPLFVWHGCTQRHLDEDCWIKKVEKRVFDFLDSGFSVCITDVRFNNELAWIQKNGGLVINIEKYSFNFGKKFYAEPANKEEEANYFSNKKYCNFNFEWEKTTDESTRCYEVKKFLENKLFRIEKHYEK